MLLREGALHGGDVELNTTQQNCEFNWFRSSFFNFCQFLRCCFFPLCVVHSQRIVGTECILKIALKIHQEMHATHAAAYTLETRSAVVQLYSKFIYITIYIYFFRSTKRAHSDHSFSSSHRKFLALILVTGNQMFVLNEVFMKYVHILIYEEQNYHNR